MTAPVSPPSPLDAAQAAGGVDVVVIQKQTALERYTRRALNVDFLEYVEQGGGSLAHLRDAHEDHVAARLAVEEALAARRLSYVLWNLDELSEKAMPPYKPAGLRGVKPSAGLVPKCKLVVSLGGDGTLLHASHAVGGDVVLLGVNSCPPHSVGALCAATADTFPALLDAVLSGKAPLVQTRRLLVTTSDDHPLPLALNDLLLCNQHPAATSRYQISVTLNLDEETTTSPGTSVPLRTETQLSSGVWVAAPAGSSAVIQGYGLPPLPLDSSAFHLAVREPYIGLDALRVARRQGKTGYAIDRLTLDGDAESLTLLCRMRTGLVCVDGPDNGVRLGFGARVNISLPEAGALRLVPRASPPSFDNTNDSVP